jgi:serine/threonine protein phosphatase PrpC
MKKPALHFFAVCDGHGVHGEKCSEFTKLKLPKYIEQSSEKNI